MIRNGKLCLYMHSLRFILAAVLSLFCYVTQLNAVDKLCYRASVNVWPRVVIVSNLALHGMQNYFWSLYPMAQIKQQKY